MTEDQVVKSWKACGIPSRYANPAKSISYYAANSSDSASHGLRSKKAQMLLELFKTPSFRTQVLHDRQGVMWVDEDEELFALLARTVAVNLSIPILYTDLLTVNQPRNTALYEACLSGDIKALFIKRFYCPSLPAAFSDSEKLRIELNLQWVADRGVALFLHFESRQTGKSDWWSPSFMRMLSRVCQSLSFPN